MRQVLQHELFAGCVRVIILILKHHEGVDPEEPANLLNLELPVLDVLSVRSRLSRLLIHKISTKYRGLVGIFPCRLGRPRLLDRLALFVGKLAPRSDDAWEASPVLQHRAGVLVLGQGHTDGVADEVEFRKRRTARKRLPAQLPNI